jgi:hypothetical protein
MLMRSLCASLILSLGAAVAAADATPAAPAGGDSAYAAPGFVAEVVDGRLYVFKAGAKELAEFEKTHQLDKMAMRVHGGPNQMTIRAPDDETLDGYLAAVGKK